MTDKESPLADIYTLLGVSQMSPMEGVRTRFYKLTRAIHRELLAAPDLDRRKELLHDLKFICIAYDILSDPVTRTDYDLRTMGLRGEAMVQTPDEKKPGELGQRLHLKIGELLNVAGLLEGSELEIACDMHKAMPEMQFGSFLVKQGFIEEYQLEAVLFAQKLLRKGLITVVQYQAAMEELESSGVPVAETVVERGYVTQSDLDHLEEVEAEAEAELNRPVTAPVYTQPALAPKVDEQATSHSNLLAQMLPPGSPDVVSARSSGNGEKSSGMLHKLLSGAQEGDITAPPSTMGGLLKGASAAAPAAPAAPVAESVSVQPSNQASTIAPGSDVPPPEAKEHKEEKASRKKKNIELHEVAQAFDPKVSRGTNEDIASDTYEGAAYKDELMKPEDIKDTGELSTQAIPQPAAEPDNFIVSGEGFLTTDEVDHSYREIMSPAESDTASSDQLGFMESSGVEFQGFVDTSDAGDEDDEDEDEEAEDEGNITLIDADGAQLVESAIQPVDNDEDLPLSAGRATDSTHERIPAYAFPDRSLVDLDSSNPVQPGTAEIGQESGDRMDATESVASQKTTRDRMPAFRPPLHNTFQLDDDSSRQNEEPAASDAGDAGDRQLIISNAVPSWKDNLEWTAAGDQSQQPSMTSSQESEVVDISRHLDLEAIEPQNKAESDEELKSFLGEEYTEDMNELSESGRPLWDVEDDEFIMPGGQKRMMGHPGAEDESAASKKVSGGWQRLKNPFELQLDAQQTAGKSGQATGEEAVVEVSNQESLEHSRAETAEFIRPSHLEHKLGQQQHAEQPDVATGSTDSADSFVEPADSLDPLEAEEDAFIVPLQGSKNPMISIALEDEEEVAAAAKNAEIQGTATTGEEPVVDQLAAEEQAFEAPLFEAPTEQDVEEEVAYEELATEELHEVGEDQAAETFDATATEEEPVAPQEDIAAKEDAAEKSAVEESEVDEAVQEEAVQEEVAQEESASAPSNDDAAAAAAGDESSSSDAGASSDNGAAAKGQDDDTASDGKAAAGADEETPLERRRRMLGRRGHKGKS